MKSRLYSKVTFVHKQVMAVAGMTAQGKPREDGRPSLWLTPPSSPHRVRSSYHTPTPPRSRARGGGGGDTLMPTDNNNGVIKEPLALRHSTGEIGTARDPSTAFFKALTKPKIRQPLIPKGTVGVVVPQRPENVEGSAESLVTQVRPLGEWPTVYLPHKQYPSTRPGSLPCALLCIALF